MPYTDEELQAIYGGLGSDTSTPTSSDVPWKTTKEIANIIPNIGNRIANSVTSIAAQINPDYAQPEYHDILKDPLPTFDVGPNRDWKDVALNNVVPEIGAWLVPYTGIAKVARGAMGAGLGAQILSEGLAQGGANYFSAVREPQGTQESPLDSGIMGTASGVVQAALPRWQRALPLAAISALTYAKTGNATEAIGNFVGNMLPGASKAAVESITTAKPPAVNPFDGIADAMRPIGGGSEEMVARHSVPIPGAPIESPFQGGQFSFMDEVHGNFPPEAPTPAAEPLRLQGPQQMDLPLQFEKPPTPPATTADELPYKGMTPIEEPAPNLPDTSGLHLEGKPPIYQQQEFPIVKLQSEGTLDPHAPGFQLLDTPATKTPVPKDLPLFDWRVNKVNEKGPLLLENAKPAEPAAPQVSSPSVEPPKPTAPEPVSTGKKDNNTFDFQTEDGTTHTIQIKRAGRKGFLADVKSGDGDWVRDAVPGGNRTKAQTVEMAKAYLEDKFTRTPEQIPPNQLAHAIAAEHGIVYQGESNGLHAFKDPDTGGNFSIPQEALHTDEVGSKLYDLRESFYTDEPGIKFGEHTDEDIEKAIQNAMAEARTPRKTISEPITPESTPTGESKPSPKDIINNEKAQDHDDMAGVETQLRAAVDLARAKNDTLGTRIALRKLNEFLDVTKPEAQEAARAQIAEKYGKADVETGTKMPTQAKDSIRRFRSRYSNESGAVSPETLAVLAVAGVGGLVAYTRTKGDIGSTLAAATVIAGLGFLGARGLRDLRALVGPEVKATKVPVPNEKIVEKIAQLAKDTARTPGGFAVFGRGGFTAQAVRMAEGLTGWSGSPAFRDAAIRSEGFIADQLNQLSDALQAARPYRPTPGFSEASARYIRGQLVDKPTVEAAIKSGGGVDAANWQKLDAAARKAFPEKWMVVDNPDITNTTGPGVTVWHVSNATKSKLVQMQKDALNSLASAKEDKEFMPFVLKSRETMDTLMQVIHGAVPPGATLDKIMGTMGQYATRSHSLLTDPKFYPSEVEISNAMDRLATLKENRFLDKYATSTSTPGSVPITYKGTTHFVSPAAADEWKNLHTPEALRSLVSQYIQEIKQIGAGKSSGLISKDTSQLGTSLFARRQELDEVTQALLGTHTDPKELIQQTINKLVPTARSAHFMQDVIQMKDGRTGLQMGYRTETEYNKAINAIKDQIRISTDARVTRDLTTRLQELSSYIPVSGQNPRMGIFQGSYVSRIAHDQLAGFTNPFGLLDNAIGRGMGEFSSRLKEFHTILNPITHIRNIVQIPMFLAMAGAADSPAVWKTAWESMQNPLSSVGRRLTLNGVFEGNYVKGEFNHTLEDLLSGNADKTIFERFFSKTSDAGSSILGMIKNGEVRAAFHKAYSMPDNFVRAASYLAAEVRAAKKYGVSVDAADPRVMAEARDFMSRRTMDFANVPQWVKTGRQVPFVSMFLSYAHEVARIGANMAHDTLKGDLKAGATLGGLAALPFLAQTQAENQLSPEDLKAWNLAQRTVPDYSRPRFKLPISRNKDGSFNYFDITPLMPFSDYQMMVKSALNKDMGGVVTTNPFVGLDKTPLLQIAGEQIAGKDFHTQRNYRNIWDRGAGIAQEILPPMTPGLGYEYKKDAPEALGGNLGVTNLRTGRTNTIEGALTRNLLGVDYTQINPGVAVKSAVADAKQEMADERAYFRDVVVSTASPDAKKRAEARYVEAIQHITQRLQAKLQLIPQ